MPRIKPKTPMSYANDPHFSESMKRHVEELVAKKKELAEIKKDIKSNPDSRYAERKEIGKEVKELEGLLCEEMDDDDEILLGRRRFKKQRTETTKYTKDRVHDFCTTKSINPEVYDEDNKEETVGLKAVGKK